MEDWDKLWARLSELSRKKHEQVIDMYFNQHIENMAEIGRTVGYSRQRVQKIISKELARRKK